MGRRTMIVKKTGLTRKELVTECKCPYYIIDYLRNLNKLRLINAPCGKGTEIKYHVDSIDLINRHLAREK